MSAAHDLREEIAENPVWYHTIELAPGVVTPGWFDLRPVVDRLPWPDVRGKRCLEVGPYDGFLSFELERRGASEVVAADIGDHADWDWSYRDRRRGAEQLRSLTGTEPGTGFAIAKRALGSSVQRLEVSVYDLTPEALGRFDVVICGSLLLHLRDPVRALEAIHGVCADWFLSAETVRLGLTLLYPRRPLAELRGGRRTQWWIPNAAGHRRMLAAAGFAIERSSRPYSIPLGPGHPQRRGARRFIRLPGSFGVPHVAVLARPKRAQAVPAARQENAA